MAERAISAQRQWLPSTISAFVGRAAELRTLGELLSQSRLVSVIGPGGAGKSRLVIERLRDFDDTPLAFVALEPVRTATQLNTAVAAALDIRDPAQELSAETLANSLGDRPVRLVLDGAEALVDALQELVTRVLAAAPGVQVVVTSRRVLGVRGEVAWTVPQLSCVSESGEELTSDAARLFLTRARERVPHLSVDAELVDELCTRLGGLPLAIELTAAWTGTLTVEQILRDRLDLLGTGSLQTVLERSWALLDEPGRELLVALCTFASEFTLDDAHAVAGQLPDFRERLRALVDSSWLSVHDTDGERRYSLLETVREFGREQLRARPNHEQVRQRHAVFFAELAAAGERGLAGPQLRDWAVRLRTADPDILEALRWARESADDDLALAMVGALWRWWLHSGQLVTGRRWSEAVVEAAGSRSDVLAGRALRGAAILAAENGDPADAVRFASAALRILEGLGEMSDAALAATILGSALRYLGEEAQARRHFETALRLRRSLGDTRGEAASLNNLALLSLDRADLEEAGRLLERALDIKRRLAEPRAIALGLCNLSEVFVRTGRLDDADRAIEEGMALCADLDDKQLRGGLLCNAGDAAARRGDWDGARELYREALRVHGEAGNEHDVIVAIVGLGRALHHSGRSVEALNELRRAEAMAEHAGNLQRLAYVRMVQREVDGGQPSPPPPGVTARQAEVLRYVAAGLSNREVAEALHLSVATVERHLATVYRNLGLRGRVAAARFATEHGLLAAPPTM